MRTKIIIIIAVLFFAGTGIFMWQKKTDSPVDSQDDATSVSDFVNQTFADNREVNLDSKQQEDNHQESANDHKVLSAEFACTGTKDSEFDCYQEYYQGLVTGQSITAAFSDLKQRYEENGYVRSQCHPLTHVIGNIAAKKFADVAEAYAQADSFCWSGYHHGVLEGIIGRIGLTKLESQMNDICKSLGEKERYSFDHYNCVHGLGHGVMAIYDDDLFKSLAICDLVTDSWERTSCWSGAFMENVIFDNKYHYSKFLKPEDPIYPCNAVGEKYKSTCYLMQTSYMLKVTNGDFSKVFNLCASIEENHRNTCYQSLGRDVSGRSLSNVAQTKAGCGLGKTLDQRTYCVIGAVKDFISYLHDDARARELCAALDEKSVQDTCYQTTESYYSTFK